MRRLIVITIALSLFAVPSLARDVDCDAAAASTAGGKKFVICHATEEYLTEGGKWKQLDGGATIRVPAGKTIVEVRATNTAVFDYKISSESVEAPEAKALNTFFESFGPYATDILRTERVAQFAWDGGIETGPLERLEETLATLDRALDNVRKSRNEVLAAFAHDNAERLKGEVDDICGSRAACIELFDGLTISLLMRYEEVESALEAVLENQGAMEEAALLPEQESEKNLARLEQIESPSPAERELAREEVADLVQTQQTRVTFLQDAKTLVASARKALDESQKALELVRTLERAVLDGVGASSTWTSAPFPITLQKGRKVTLKITPKPIAAIASAGRYPKMDVAFTLLPQWKIRPAVGLSLLWADGATYPTFGTSKTSVMVDGMAVDRFEIVEKDLEDRRANYGLDLGLTSRALCSEKGNCPWLDVIVNPSDDVRALGLGASYNFGIFKLGGGVLWTKHKELDGQSLGDLLEADGDLKTRDSYSGEEFYVSISVIGWQPFVND